MELFWVGEMGIFGEILQNRANIDISWTDDIRNSFNPSNWPQDPLFYLYFIHCVPLRWLKVPKNAQNVKTGVKWPKWGSTPISREPRLLETGLTPHFSQKHHVSISVLHISYLSDDWKCSKMPIKGKKGPKRCQNGPNSISHESLVVETW